MDASYLSPVFHVKHRQVALLLLLLSVFASSCTMSRNPVSGRQRALAWSWSQERQLGAEADQQIVAQFGVYDDEQLSAYITRIGEEVLAESHMRRPDTPGEFRETPFYFRVLDSPVVNAFALPGGYVYLTRGLLAHLNNEAQLAVVLGHEIAHVAARHAAQRALQQQLGQVAVLGGAILGQEVLGLPAQDLLNLGGVAAQLLFLSYGRDDERESDRLGVEYAALAAYQAEEGSEFFRSLQRISEEADQELPTFLSTHPDPGEREVTIRRLAAEWQRQTEMSRLGEQDLLSAIDGIVVGDNPRQGFTEGGVFYHPDLEFRFPVPANFQVINQPTQVVMVEQQQRAIEILTISQQSTARAAAEQFAGQQGLSIVTSRSIQVNGLPAYLVVADAQNQQGQAFRILTYFIEYNGRVYVFMGYSTRQDFGNFENVFLRSMTGFDRLTDPNILGVQPTRLDVTTAQQTAQFQNFLPSRLPRDMSAQDLAIMNQVDLNEQIPQGATLKLTQ